ncbi:MAG: DUF3141 domain-containing protein, partial [Pseudomonadota bacterium]
MTFSTSLKEYEYRQHQVQTLFFKRLTKAHIDFVNKISKSWFDWIDTNFQSSLEPTRNWVDWNNYLIDSWQRQIIFFDTLRERGNNYNHHVTAGMPPVLSFKFKTLIDGRTFEKPVNYSLVKIIPPPDTLVDENKRPYVIIDPRAGHGPGIGGFKEASQVGVALTAGHPVYFLVFSPEPEPNQTLLDVCQAEVIFIRHVRERHPQCLKPVIVGNCQGGWATMMLAASDPDNVGPLVLSGAPMAFWGGSFNDDQQNNPMRYSSGFLGGTWLSSFICDLSGGVFDGAWLVSNFENLNPANSLWSKYYNLYKKIDTERNRFLDFERWWSGFFLMNKSEIEWITQNLFIGNHIWNNKHDLPIPQEFDLKKIQSPIILFASKGDNITPTQQAFNWIADVYKSTEEIKALGQVIVALVHENVGHLGIFVSGKVAKKEHTHIVSVLESIEGLSPGLYAMKINKGGQEHSTSEFVEFQPLKLEECESELNIYHRADEKAFISVCALSKWNQKNYDQWISPWLSKVVDKTVAKQLQQWHPLRFQRWSLSNLNPMMKSIPLIAKTIMQNRIKINEQQTFRRMELANSQIMVSSLNLYRDFRDAATEWLFLNIYGLNFAIILDRLNISADEFVLWFHTQILTEPANNNIQKSIDHQKNLLAQDTNISLNNKKQLIDDALAKIRLGGYHAAVVRSGELLKEDNEPVSLERLEVKKAIYKDYQALLPKVSENQMNKMRGQQELIV